MRLKIKHRTEYHYDMPVQYGLQRLRLLPREGKTQSVLSWNVVVGGAREEVRFSDQFGNDTRLVSIEGDPRVVSVEATGEVETHDTAGVSGPHTGFAPLWLFSQATPLTEAGEGIRDLAASIAPGAEIDRLHQLLGMVRERVAYIVGATDAETTAEEALKQGSGVCQDHAHVFSSAARLLGIPARYVSGYLMMDGTIEQVASHAWAEAYVSTLGWVAFDAANGISPDERYVRLATGRDYRDAMPVSGIRLGQASEQLAVHITVEQ
ncbi:MULTISPECIES: transglutaminase family protein [unclassified Mesorhizobium]|uniref:transglutaminase family protein n=1 Tax=unclassified Mesorhizobium TaxID=325217 RepID=UPI0030145AE7